MPNGFFHFCSSRTSLQYIEGFEGSWRSSRSGFYILVIQMLFLTLELAFSFRLCEAKSTGVTTHDQDMFCIVYCTVLSFFNFFNHVSCFPLPRRHQWLRSWKSMAARQSISSRLGRRALFTRGVIGVQPEQSVQLVGPAALQQQGWRRLHWSDDFQICPNWTQPADLYQSEVRRKRDLVRDNMELTWIHLGRVLNHGLPTQHTFSNSFKHFCIRQAETHTSSERALGLMQSYNWYQNVPRVCQKIQRLLLRDQILYCCISWHGETMWNLTFLAAICYLHLFTLFPIYLPYLHVFTNFTICYREVQRAAVGWRYGGRGGSGGRQQDFQRSMRTALPCAIFKQNMKNQGNMKTHGKPREKHGKKQWHQWRTWQVNADNFTISAQDLAEEFGRFNALATCFVLKLTRYNKTPWQCN